MQKNLIGKPKFSCCKCGSENTEMSKVLWSEVSKISKFLGLHKVTAKPPFLGTVFVRCKECGHESMLQIM